MPCSRHWCRIPRRAPASWRASLLSKSVSSQLLLAFARHSKSLRLESAGQHADGLRTAPADLRPGGRLPGELLHDLQMRVRAGALKIDLPEPRAERHRIRRARRAV